MSAGVSATFPAPPAADVGGAYSDTLTATGGTTPYTWSVNAGTLPPGLSLSSAGVLAGTPTTAGSYPFTVNVIDANNGIATASITLVVSSGVALSFAGPAEHRCRHRLQRYAHRHRRDRSLYLVGERGEPARGDHAERVDRGAGRDGDDGGDVQLHGQGDRCRWPERDQGGDHRGGGAAVAGFPRAAAGQASVAYSDTLTVTGGTGPFTWSVPAGGLPPGLTLNASTGVLAGTPAAAGSFAFTVQVSDAFAVTATEAVTLVIGSGPLVIAATVSPSAAVPGGTVHFTVTVTNTGPSTYTGATFTDPLTDVLDDASYNSNAAATAGTVGFTSPNLTWTGNLAAGRGRDHHVLGDGEQPRHREQDPGQHDHLGHGRAATARPAAPTPGAPSASRCRS